MEKTPEIDYLAICNAYQRAYNRITGLSALVVEEKRQPTEKEMQAIGIHYKIIMENMPELIEEFRRLHARYQVESLDITKLDLTQNPK